MKTSMRFTFWPAAAVLALGLTPAGFGDDGNRLLRIDHYAQVRSAVPAISEQLAQIYFREVVEAGTVLRGGLAADRVALFIHGAGTPGEVTDIIARYRDAGADEIIVPDRTLGSMARKKDTCDLFMREVAPAFR